MLQITPIQLKEAIEDTNCSSKQRDMRLFRQFVITLIARKWILADVVDQIVDVAKFFKLEGWEDLNRFFMDDDELIQDLVNRGKLSPKSWP